MSFVHFVSVLTGMFDGLNWVADSLCDITADIHTQTFKTISRFACDLLAFPESLLSLLKTDAIDYMLTESNYKLYSSLSCKLQSLYNFYLATTHSSKNIFHSDILLNTNANGFEV